MRSGFYGRVGFVIGSVSVSHGLGGFGNEIIIIEAPELAPPTVLIGRGGPGTRGFLAPVPFRLDRPLDCPPKVRVPQPPRPSLRGTSPRPLSFKSFDEAPRVTLSRVVRPRLGGVGPRRGPRTKTEKKKG